MESTKTAYELMSYLMVGGILGILGQGIRIIIGLKKLDDQRARTAENEDQELFSNSRLLISIFIGFVAGALALLTKWGGKLNFDHELIVTIMAAGYAGADFIEGLFNTYFKKISNGGKTTEKAVRSSNNSKKMLRRDQKLPKTIENEVKIAILITDGEYHPDPATLSSTKKMEDFGFSDIQNIALTDKFNIIVKSRNPNGDDITINQVTACETVQECIDLVTNAI